MSFWSPGGLAAVVLAHLGILAALMSVRSAPLPGKRCSRVIFTRQ